MGIIADVNLHSKNGKDYIEIKVDPSSYPVSYHGEYHYRSGSTKQLLRGSALTEFLVEKTGYRWDAVPVDGIGVDDLDRESIEIFRREALRRKRMTKEDLDLSNAELLEHLDLLAEGKLKRAAVMLFYHRPGRIVTGSYVKIGMFNESGSEILYQDVLEGSLFSIADKVIDLIYTKYLKAVITYDHDVRMETYPFPREGVREAVFNALCHNDYAGSVPIQIRIQEEALQISNTCVLPRNWTVETLLHSHKSMPYNPSIANAFYRAGYIEAWGRGIQKIIESCREYGSPEPEFTLLGDSLNVKFPALKSAVISKGHSDRMDVRKDDRMGVPIEQKLDGRVLDMIAAQRDISLSSLAEQLAVSYRTVQRSVKRLKEKGLLIRAGGNRYGYWEIK